MAETPERCVIEWSSRSSNALVLFQLSLPEGWTEAPGFQLTAQALLEQFLACSIRACFWPIFVVLFAVTLPRLFFNRRFILTTASESIKSSH